MAKIFSFLLHFHLSIINYMISFIKMLKEKKFQARIVIPALYSI